MSIIIKNIYKLYKIPFNYYKTHIKLPIIYFLSDLIELYKSKTVEQANNAKELLIRSSILVLIFSSLVWLSIIMYLVFYFAYVPYISHSKSVHFNFKSCGSEHKPVSCVNKNVCSFPSTHVKLTNKNQLLMPGQPYKIFLELEMPESQSNKDLGMFMVCAEFRTRDGHLVQISCRTAMLTYHSPLLYMLKTIVFSPALVLGTLNQKQKVSVELFSDYEDDEQQPVTDVFIEVQTHSIELYSANFLIVAHFTGLRYLMYYWPITSAVIGIISNLFFIIFICVVTWYQIITSEEYLNYKIYKQTIHYKKTDSEDSFSADDVSVLEESSDDLLKKETKIEELTGDLKEF